MPWPEFSELSFGFSFLREFERLYSRGGTFPTAPDFISQAEEATKGYDVEIALEGGTPVFFQFKRSFVIKSKAAHEIATGPFQEPLLYRMSLMRKNKFNQHLVLQDLERKGLQVFYVTSQVATPEELSDCYVDRTVTEKATAIFSPNDIPLPDLAKPHHVTFEAGADFGYIFSKEGKRFERTVSTPANLAERRLMKARASAEQNRERLRAFVREVRTRRHRAGELANRFDDPVAQASVLAAYVLDAQLVIFNPNPSKIRLWLKASDNSAT